MGKENDGPKGRDHEDCGQDRLRRFWLPPVEDVVGKLLGNEIGEAGRERGGITRLEAAIERKGRIVAV